MTSYYFLIASLLLASSISIALCVYGWRGRKRKRKIEQAIKLWPKKG